LADYLFGTSGWSYTEWVGPFYEKKERMLTYYSKLFRTVEINSTFYSYPTRAQIYGYYRTSPRGFIFSAKMPKVLTHQKRLAPELYVKNDLLQFLELMEPLRKAGKLGAILIQLPPSFTYKKHHENLAAFFEILPEDYEFAVEFRDYSWFRNDVWNLLKKHNVAYTIVDEPLLPPEIHVTSDFSYIRWHGRGSRIWYDYHYKREELEEWIPRILRLGEKVKKVYGYFNNHFHGYAPENCIEILEMLNLAKPEQIRVKENIKEYHEQKKSEIYEIKIGEYTLQDYSVEGLLQRLTTKSRLDRGMRISDDELSIDEVTDDRITATIRDYMIDIDLKDKKIAHDCEDWRKGLGMKRICKHLCKLFLSLPESQSTLILKDIIEKKTIWSFIYGE